MGPALRHDLKPWKSGSGVDVETLAEVTPRAEPALLLDMLVGRPAPAGLHATARAASLPARQGRSRQRKP